MSENQQQVKVSKVGRKFAIGYQMGGEMTSDDWIEVISRHRESILEVYFAMPGDMSGRAPAGLKLEERKTDGLLEAFWNDLERLKAMDVSGVMLFNSACYGVENQSQKLLDHVGESIEAVRQHIELKAVTTLHPAIAQYVKSHYPELKVRSSITMQIGTIPQMEAVAEQFDGFYLHRDFNRDLEHIRGVRQWCDENGKSLHLLANSGCIYQCPHHHYHENIVAHINEIVSKESAYKGTLAPCFRMLKDKSIQFWVLRNTWIRPEDIRNYVDLFDTIKLATRESTEPEYTLLAYTLEKWNGNLLDILEPGHGNVEGMPLVINSRFPEDWFEHTTHCGHHCDTCDYCKNVFEKVSKIPQAFSMLS